MHRHSIAKPLQLYLNLTVQLSAHFTPWLDYERSALTLPTLWQDCKSAAVGKNGVCLRIFSNFENPCSAQRQNCEHEGEIMNDDGGTDTTCELVNFCERSIRRK